MIKFSQQGPSGWIVGLGLTIENLRLVGEELGVMLGEHARARPAGRDDVVAIGEGLDRAPRDRFRVGAVSRIIGGLAAAGLLGHEHPAAGVFEQLDRSEADARAHRVDEAGDEQADALLRARRSDCGLDQ